jgi:predicted DNA binding CopG/RHH family protein
MTKSLPAKIASSDEAWEEGALGRDGSHAKRVAITPAHRAKLDEKMDLQPISIRLPVDLLVDLKDIAKMNGLGYQPLIRQVLTRFAHAELKSYAREAMSKARQAAATEPPMPNGGHKKAA